MHRADIKTVPGTKVELVIWHGSNPARNNDDVDLFVDGYWEIVITSDGSNLHFPKGIWNILFVVTREEYEGLIVKDEYCIVIATPPYATVIAVDTDTRTVQETGDQAMPVCTVTLLVHGDERKEVQLVFAGKQTSIAPA